MRAARAARIAALAIATLWLAAPAAASEPCADDERVRLRGITFRLENDLFVQRDRDYTNGVSLTAISRDMAGPIRPECMPWPIRLHAEMIARLDPGFWRDDGAAQARNVVLKFGQSMYTPGDQQRTDLIVDDRPYAGLLYVGVAWNRRRHEPASAFELLDTREITLGVIGPGSLARQTQDLVHDLKGVEKFQGWQHQLGNEPALQLALDRKYRGYRGDELVTPGFSTDAIPSLGLRLGNIETSASAGIEARAGWNLPNDFGTYPIRPGAENRPPVAAAGARPAAADRTIPTRRPGVHLFAILEAKAVAHDFSLDGNLFRDSHHVTRRPLVGQGAIGLSLQHPVAGGGVKLALMRVYRTREYEQQTSNHSFGSIALSFEFAP